MKLLTEMQDGCVHVNGCCVDFTDLSNGVLDTLEHDAACAHALWQAIRMLEQSHAYGYMEEIQGYADELMREWGFDSTPEQPE